MSWPRCEGCFPPSFHFHFLFFSTPPTRPNLVPFAVSPTCLVLPWWCAPYPDGRTPHFARVPLLRAVLPSVGAESSSSFKFRRFSPSSRDLSTGPSRAFDLNFSVTEPPPWPHCRHPKVWWCGATRRCVRVATRHRSAFQFTSSRFSPVASVCSPLTSITLIHALE